MARKGHDVKGSGSGQRKQLKKARQEERQKTTTDSTTK